MYLYKYVQNGDETMTFLVASGKGGVGKSTLTCAVASSLAKDGKRVLVLDGDAGLRCQDILFGVAEDVFYDWADVLCGNVAASDAILKTPSGVDLIPAPALRLPDYDAEAFASMVRSLEPEYDMIFLDAPAGIGDGLTLLCAAANRGLVVAGCDAASVRGACAAGDVLKANGVSSVRLLINSVKPSLIRKGKLPNLDSVIDRTEIRLIGVFPYDETVADTAAAGAFCPEEHELFAQAADNVARRLTGEAVPLTKL